MRHASHGATRRSAPRLPWGAVESRSAGHDRCQGGSLCRVEAAAWHGAAGPKTARRAVMHAGAVLAVFRPHTCPVLPCPTALPPSQFCRSQFCRPQFCRPELCRPGFCRPRPCRPRLSQPGRRRRPALPRSPRRSGLPKPGPRLAPGFPWCRARSPMPRRWREKRRSLLLPRNRPPWQTRPIPRRWQHLRRNPHGIRRCLNAPPPRSSMAWSRNRWRLRHGHHSHLPRSPRRRRP
jgi:hypothetical protein